MLSEEYSFESLARQYGVGANSPAYDDGYLDDSERFTNVDEYLDRLVTNELTESLETPMSYHFDFDRAEQYGLVAGRADAPMLAPVQARVRPSSPVQTLARRSSVGASPHSQMVVEPSPGNKISLLPVSDLSDPYRSLFSFPFFNAVQSKCLPSVFRSTSNVVLSAPTGAGKTVVFELAIIRMLMNEPANTKAVYLAPTKALCTERTRDWTKRFGALDCGIIELTGDSVHGLQMARKARIIVTTPEKWDSLTRRWEEQQGILSTIRLFLIDEVHILNEPSRGARLEVVVTRTKTHGSRVRFVAVSATIPNLEDVARWIGRGTGAIPDGDDKAIMFQFGDEFRPCKLERFVYGYPKSKDEFSFQSYLNHKLYDLVTTHAAGRPCLIFVATRRSTVQAARLLAESIDATIKDGGQALGHQRKSSNQVTFDDKDLQDLSARGVGFHHAGLSTNDRRKVEAAFLAENLSILCCTSTLATGVNLPAFCVIIRGTKQFDGQWNELSELDIIQMMGRAGRPQFDREGVAVIMCEDNLQQKYRELATGSRDIESGLGVNLVEHVNAEIGLRGRTSTDQMEAWLKKSFLWTRLQKNPTYYLTRDEGICLDSSAEISTYLCTKTLSILEKSSLIVRKEHSSDLVSTEYGDIMSRFFLRHTTMLALMNLEPGAGARAILEAVCEAEEFANLRIRQGEKSYLQALRVHAEVRFPPKQIAKVKDKVLLLIQATLSAINLSQLPKAHGADQNPFSDVRAIFSHAPRIVKAVMDIAIHRRDGLACKTALDLARSVTAQAWDGSPAMLRQIEHVGEKSIKALASAGLGTWSSLAASTAARIEMILNRNPPFGSNIVKAAQSVPRLGLDVLQRPGRGGREAEDLGVVITIDISIRMENRATCMMKSKISKLPLSACVLTLTSDYEYVDFRRMPLWRIDTGKTFTLSCRLTDLQTRVFVYAACDEIAGTLIMADLSPADMVSNPHRTKLVRARMPHDVGQMPPHESSGARELNAGDDVDLEDRQPKRCKHKCKRKCRHICCQAVPEASIQTSVDKDGGATANVLARSSLSASPDFPINLEELQETESLMEKIDRLTAACDAKQISHDTLPALRLPGRAPATGSSNLSLRPADKQANNESSAGRAEQRQSVRSDLAAFSDAKPPQRRFLQTLSQPSWLSNTAIDDAPSTKARVMPTDPYDCIVLDAD